MSRQALAQEILNRRTGGNSSSGRIINYWRNPSGAEDGTGRSPRDNVQQTADGLQATRAIRSSDGIDIGGTVFICEDLLRAILHISDQFGNIQVNALAGTRHYRYSRHYGAHVNASWYSNLRHMPFLCIAVDLQVNTTTGIVVGTNVTRETIIRFLENAWGFVTQSSFSLAPSRSLNSDNDGVFHLEIWGRSPSQDFIMAMDGPGGYVDIIHNFINSHPAWAAGAPHNRDAARGLFWGAIAGNVCWSTIGIT
jgi:hypothetical protein